MIDLWNYECSVCTFQCMCCTCSCKRVCVCQSNLTLLSAVTTLQLNQQTKAVVIPTPHHHNVMLHCPRPQEALPDMKLCYTHLHTHTCYFPLANLLPPLLQMSSSVSCSNLSQELQKGSRLIPSVNLLCYIKPNFTRQPRTPLIN